MEITQEFSKNLGLIAFDAIMVELKKAFDNRPLGKINPNEILAMCMMSGLTFLEKLIILGEESAGIPPAVTAKEFVTGLLICYGQKAPTGTQH